MDEKRLYPVYDFGTVRGTAGPARGTSVPPVIVCEGEMDVLQAQQRGVRAVCITGRTKLWPGVSCSKAWSRKRPRWYRRQTARALRIGSVHG